MNYYGQETEIDGADRVLIPALLRESASVVGEVFVIGSDDHLEVWNRDRFDTDMRTDPINAADLEALAIHRI